MRWLVPLWLITLSVEVPAVDETSVRGDWPPSFALLTPDLGRYQGIPRFPTNMPVSSVLRATVQLLDEDLELQWDEPLQGGLKMDPAQLLFMGATGEAFTFLWFPRGGGRPPLDPTLYWPDPAAPYKRALAATGFSCEVLARPGLPGGDASQPLGAQMLKDRVRGCLVDQRLPVIIAGIPEPWSFMLVSGYGENGEVLTGWKASGGGGEMLFDPAAKAEARQWADAAQLVVLLTGLQDRPPLEATMRDAMQQAVGLLRMAEAGPYHAGPANFEAWAEALLSDDPPDLAVDPNPHPQTIEGRRRWLICPATWDLMERAAYATRFLRRAAPLFTAAAGEIEAAAARMAEVGDLMVRAERVMGSAAGPDPTQGYPNADEPEARRQMADMLLQCRDKELQAADHLEAALELMQ